MVREEDPQSRGLILADRYRAVRARTPALCAPLELEDLVVQPTAEASPPKWHLAHTTWFFEEFLLAARIPGYRRYHDGFGELFNSYYKALGKHWAQGARGTVSRPPVAEVLRYRARIDEHVLRYLGEAELTDDTRFLITLGLNHEEQHQELLLMDIKAILAANPIEARYSARALPRALGRTQEWQAYPEGVHRIGYAGGGFSFDNEGPKHETYLHAFALSSRLVTNGEYIDFIESGGYLSPEHWLSAGWDWVQGENIAHPLYWRRDGERWTAYTLHGWLAVDPAAPVAHVSYYEADAFARWKGLRLPGEAELELAAASGAPAVTAAPDLHHPLDAGASAGQLWCWTRSAYAPYPGFRAFPGRIREYNEKFMCGQYVLRGGSLATPAGHHRVSYRNFFLPEQRWMFSGIRLARDLPRDLR